MASAKAEAHELVVEICTGTGQIGEVFARSSLRYIGFDISLPMLKVFECRLTSSARNCLLVQADANCDWPVANKTARIIFSARSVHLLSPEHVVREVLRIARDGAVFLNGRVKRAEDSLKMRMRRQMRQRGRELGLIPHRAGQQLERLDKNLLGIGARPMDPVTVASWIAEARPIDVIDEWAAKSGLAGVNLAPSVKRNVLDGIKAWAEEKFCGLDRSFRWEESFTLHGVRFTG